MAYAPSKSRRVSQKTRKEVNLIPIMNLFLVIIPMLMTMMVSIRLAMIGINYSSESTIPDNTQEKSGGGGSKKDTPKLITLKVRMDNFEIEISDRKKPIKIPILDNNLPIKYDFVALDQELNNLHSEYEDMKTIVILTDPNVKFDTLLRSIDVCKANNFPNVKYLAVRKKYIRKTR